MKKGLFFFVLLVLFGCIEPRIVDSLSKYEKDAISKIEIDCDCSVRVEKDGEVVLNNKTEDGTFWIITNYNESRVNLCEVEDSLLQINRARKYASWFLDATDKKDESFSLYTKVTIKLYSSVFPNDRTEDPTCWNTYTFSIDSLKLIEYRLTNQLPVYLDTNYIPKRMHHKVEPMKEGEGYLLKPIKNK